MNNILSLLWPIAQFLPLQLVLILTLCLPLPSSLLIALAASLTPSPAVGLANDTSSSLALAPAAASTLGINTSDSSLYNWIVEGNSTGKLAPNCSDLCVMVPNDEQNFPVVLQHCQGLSSSEIWIYDTQSMTIISDMGYTSNVRLCVDATNPEQLYLSECSGSINQTWIWDNQTMRFQSGINDTSTGSPMFLKGERSQASDWGTGKNNYTLQLVTESTDTNYDAVFTLLPFHNPLHIYPPASNSNLKNLVINGGFESCGWDPAKGFITIDTTQPIYLCSWFVMSNEVEYSGTNLWQPEEGTHSLHLNSAKIAQPATITQVLATKMGSNYTLIFFMAGNPIQNCGTKNKTMQVEVSPSSLPAQSVWFDISKAASGQMGWKQMYPMGFTALADYVNLTYKSLTPGSCGPVIDNITVQEIKGPLPPLNPFGLTGTDDGSSTRSSMPDYAKVLIGMAVAGCVIAVISLLIMRVMKKRREDVLRRGGPSNYGSSRSPEDAKWWDSFHLANLESDEGGVKEWTWRQIEKATRNFTTIVGEGGFSTVYRAELGNGTIGAVKMEKTRDRSRQIFKQELSVLARLRHPNLVNLLGFCNEREEGILVFEYMAHGSLHHRLHPLAHQMYMALSWKKRMEIALQVARALQYLHDGARPAVVHGDVKAANVLLDDDDNAKVCDFGFSSKAGPNSSVFHSTVATVKGSLGYLDPHYLKNGRLSSKSDVYSFGVLLMELLTGLRAFDVHRAEALTSFAAPYFQDMDMMELIVDARLAGAFDRAELSTACHVARLCLQEEAASRPTMAEVVCQLSSAATDHDGDPFSSFSE